MKHTKEPWVNLTEGGFIHAPSTDQVVCQLWSKYEDDFHNHEANSQRIVECVNALAGVADPANAIAAAREALEWTLGQAEELLGAHTGGPYECAYRERIAHARATLALLEGVQP